MILEGRILLFDVVNKNRDIFPKDCKIDIPEKVPLTWNFNHEQVIGFAKVIKDDKGLFARAEIMPNEHFSDNDIRKVFEDGKIGSCGFYNHIKTHNEGSFFTFIVVDEAKLFEVTLVLAPVNEKYYFEIVKEEKKK